MPSKSKNVRIEQLRVFEKKLALRLKQLEQKGISKENAQKDPIVKNLKSKITETKLRIAALEKLVRKNQELAQAKAQKLAEPAGKEEKPEPAPTAKEAAKEAEKPKKKAEAAAKESKKQAASTGEEAPKKAKKQPAAEGEAAPKKKTAKKKEE